MKLEELKYPKKGEKIFKEGTNMRKTAYIGWNNDISQFWGYIEGYKRGGDVILKNAICDSSNLVLDTSIFPAVFCYRQYIELTLKYIILLGEYNSTGSCQFPKGHNLSFLWGRCKKILDWYNEGKNQEYLDVIEEYILDFNSMDPNSENFRYPVDNCGQIIHNTVKRIDLVNLMDRMEEMYNFFDGCQSMIDAKNNSISEMKEEERIINDELRRELESEIMSYWN